MGVGKIYPSYEATNASTEMQVSAFDMYSGMPIPLGNVNEQEHCATALVGSKQTFINFCYLQSIESTFCTALGTLLTVRIRLIFSWIIQQFHRPADKPIVKHEFIR